MKDNKKATFEYIEQCNKHNCYGGVPKGLYRWGPNPLARRGPI